MKNATIFKNFSDASNFRNPRLSYYKHMILIRKINKKTHVFYEMFTKKNSLNFKSKLN